VPTASSTSFRFAPELLGRLDAYAKHLSAQTGVPVSRAAAAAKLLTAALDQEDSTDREKRPSSRASRR